MFIRKKNNYPNIYVCVRPLFIALTSFGWLTFCTRGLILFYELYYYPLRHINKIKSVKWSKGQRVFYDLNTFKAHLRIEASKL